MNQDQTVELDGIDELYEPVCSELHILVSPSYCAFCGAKKFQFEPPTLCCYNGEVDLAPTAVPDDLYELLKSQSKEAIEFRRRIRLYNSLFSFTSFGVHLDKDLASSKDGVYTFRALGQVYHNLPGLARNNNGPCYLQLYIYDTENEVKNRMNAVEDARPNETLVCKLMEILSLNPYVKFFRTLRDIPSVDEYEVLIKSDIKLDQRVYNMPTASQVAAIWIEGNTPGGSQERDIIISTKSGKSYKVRHYFGCYDPLQYPILFPYGEVGWHQNIKKRDKDSRNNKGQESANTINATSADDILDREETGILKGSRGTVSCRQYYSYKFQIRDKQHSIILHAGRLLQQYVVDMYIKLESTRMDFFRKEQSTIRAELYQGIVDCVQSGENKGRNIGQRIVLPASFIGGPRDMRRRYLNAMALVQRYEKPDFFITMTCNSVCRLLNKQVLCPMFINEVCVCFSSLIYVVH